MAVIVAVITVFMCSNFFRILKSSAISAASKTVFGGGDLKQVYIVRTDLDMGKGKIAAQCCHAAVKAFQDLGSMGKEVKAGLNQWEWQGSRKVVLRIGSEDELAELINNARHHGLYATTIRDAGKTQIAAGSMTVGVIGPANQEIIDKVSGHLKLL